MKKILLTIALLLVFVTPAFAQENSLRTTGNTVVFQPPKNYVGSPSGRSPVGIQTQTINNLKTRAINEIDKRITSLNDLITKINTVKKIPADVKSQLVTQIQNEISSLQALKTKIQADTTFTTLLADAKSIITSFRTYAFFMPKITIIAVADRLNQTTDNLSTISAKLQTRINQAKANGKDTTSLDTLIADLNTQIVSAKTEYQNVVSQAESMTITSFTGVGTFQTLRADIVAGEKDLKVALQDAKQIIEGLRKLELPSPTPPTPSPT